MREILAGLPSCFDDLINRRANIGGTGFVFECLENIFIQTQNRFDKWIVDQAGHEGPGQHGLAGEHAFSTSPMVASSKPFSR